MPAISLLPPEQWEEVRIASIRGVPDETLSKQFDIPKDTIRKRRERDPAWQAAVSARPGQAPRNPEKVRGLSQIVQKPSETVISASISDSLRVNGEKCSLFASQLALSKLQKAAENPESISDLKDMSDVKVTMSVARIAGGMDKEGTEVKVNLAMFSGEAAPEQGPVWEVDGDETSGDSVV